MICHECKQYTHLATMREEKYYCEHCFMQLFKKDHAKQCVTCNKLFNPDDCYPSAYVKDNCFDCSYWLRLIDDLKTRTDIIVADSKVYIVGIENVDRYFRGFGGRQFTFKLRDGSILKSTNIWNGSSIPEMFRKFLPDTAELLR